MKKSELLKPTNDYVFKRIFGKKGNEDITASFIEAVTNIRYNKINLDSTPILERDLIENKMGVLDVKVVADKNDNIDIEMQVARSAYIADRILWYWAKMYTNSIEKGKGYNTSKKAICILIADFDIELLKDIPKYHTKWEIREEEYKDVVLTDKLEIHIIVLDNLEKIYKTKKEETKLMNWCKFIKAPEKLEEYVIMEDEEIKKAKEELDTMSQDEKERRIAELREKAIRDEMTLIASGYKEGEEAGIKKGIEQGIEKGAKETGIKIAKSMLKENLDIKLISKITGLTEKEIKELKV